MNARPDRPSPEPGPGAAAPAAPRRHPPGRWLAATRPGFLLLTAAGVVLGSVQAWACGCAQDLPAAAAALGLAVLAHAAANLWNDWGDAVSGADALNDASLFPFTGGSRLIQTGEFRAEELRDAAQVLAIVVVGGGVWLSARVGPWLLLTGLVGLALGWAYSQPRVALVARGAGEATVALAWGGVVVGADLVQRHAFSAIAALTAVGFALLAAAILWINEFPDARADAAAGKRTLVVRLGPEAAALGHLALGVAAHAWTAAWWWADWLPTRAGWGLLSLPLSLAASALLWRHRRRPAALRPAIVLSILAALVHAAGLSAAFLAVVALR